MTTGQITCEGSGRPGYLLGMTHSTSWMMGTCAVCGNGVACNFQGIAELHLRKDLAATAKDDG